MTQSIGYYRGESIDIVLDPLPGDLTGRELVFTVKENYDFEEPRMIYKVKSRGDITAVYNSTTQETTVTILMTPEDTNDLPGKKYVWDLDSINPYNPEDIITPIYGTFNLRADVRTESDGYPLNKYAKRFFVFNAEDCSVGDIIQCQLNSYGEKVFVNITLTELKSQLNQIP